MSREWAALVVGLAAALPVPGAQDSDAAAQREAIHKERVAIETRFKAGEAECKQRFAVSGCIADLQAKRRHELEALRQRELVLDEAKRKAEAQENTRRLDAKRTEAQNRPPPEPRGPPPRAASSPGAGASAPAAKVRAPKPSKTADDAASAAARVEAQQRRASEAAAHREAVEQRNAERAARGKKSTPLPLPAPLPPPSPPASAASR